MKRVFILCFILLSLLSYSNGGTIHPTSKDADHLAYGSQFDCVGTVCGIYEDNTFYCASCVAIKPNWFLTAAHVVNKSKKSVVTINDKSIPINTIFIHKDFDTKFGQYDIALMYCADDIGLKFYPELYTKDDEVGKLCSIAGYGLVGTFTTGATKSDFKKRAGSNIIDNVIEDMLMCSPSNKNRTALEFLIGSGDSGGGLFIDQKLAGINSCVLASDGKPDSTYSDESGHTRISKYIEWIKEIIDEKEK